MRRKGEKSLFRRRKGGKKKGEKREKENP